MTWVLDNNLPPGFPGIKQKFGVLLMRDSRGGEGRKSIEFLPNQMVRECSISELVAVITNYVKDCVNSDINQISGKFNDYKTLFQDKKARDVAISYLNHSINILKEQPADFLFKTDVGYCYKRTDFDACLCDEEIVRDYAPAWMEVTDRMDNAEAFMIRIGSLFDPKADRKQVVWLYGDPDCGKSTFMGVFQDLMGQAANTLSPKELEGSYWTSNVANKRLIIVSEADSRFARSGAFKIITGDKDLTVSRKYCDSFLVKNNCIMFFISNRIAAIPGDDALFKRIIPVHIDNFKGEMQEEESYKSQLESQLPWFIGHCISLYSMKKTRRIENCQQALHKSSEEFDSEAYDFIEGFLVFGDKEICLKRVLDNKLRQVIKDPMVQRRVKQLIQEAPYNVQDYRGNITLDNGKRRPDRKWVGCRVRDGY